MSVINKMLKDLDRRNASPEDLLADGEAIPAAGELRSVRRAKTVSHAVFWWLMSALMLLAIGWLAWVMWELTPRPVVNELALRRAPRAVEENARPVPAAPSAFRNDRIEPGGQVATPFAGPADMLRLATEITTPIRGRSGVRTEAPVADRTAELPVVPGPQQPVRNVVQPQTPPGMAATAGAERAPAGSALERIIKRPTVATRDQSEAEYRRAAGLIAQGRVHEGMDGLRAVLNLDPSHETARQALVSLALEQRRVEEAAAVLAQGLELNPANSGFAMLLARVLVERKDYSAALDLLKKHAPGASRNPDYHAFTGALLQRLSRHEDAVGEYRIALQMSPQAAPWWVGLGISQEALGRGKDALGSYRRARELGASGELLGYVEQRLQKLE